MWSIWFSCVVVTCLSCHGYHFLPDTEQKISFLSQYFVCCSLFQIRLVLYEDLTDMVFRSMSLIIHFSSAFHYRYLLLMKMLSKSHQTCLDLDNIWMADMNSWTVSAARKAWLDTIHVFTFRSNEDYGNSSRLLCQTLIVTPLSLLKKLIRFRRISLKLLERRPVIENRNALWLVRKNYRSAGYFYWRTRWRHSRWEE